MGFRTKAKQFEKLIEKKISGAAAAAPEPLDVVRAVVGDVQDRIVPAPGGRLTFPYDRVLVRVAVSPDARRPWKATLDGPSGLETAVRALLKRSGCDAGVEFKVRYADARGDDWSHEWYDVQYRRRRVEQTVAVPIPRVQLAVLKGLAARKRYSFQLTRINIGRSAEVLSAEQSAVARRDDGDEAGDEGVREGVARADAEQRALNPVPADGDDRQREAEAEQQAEGNLQRALLQHHPEDAPAGRAERHANAELRRALVDRKRHHAVDADRREHDGHQPEDREHRGDDAVRADEAVEVLLWRADEIERQVRVDLVDVAPQRVGKPVGLLPAARFDDHRRELARERRRLHRARAAGIERHVESGIVDVRNVERRLHADVRHDAHDRAPRPGLRRGAIRRAEAAADGTCRAEMFSRERGVDDRHRQLRVQVVVGERAPVEPLLARHVEERAGDLLEVGIRAIALLLVDLALDFDRRAAREHHAEAIREGDALEFRIVPQLAHEAIEEQLARVLSRIVAVHQPHARRHDTRRVVAVVDRLLVEDRAHLEHR